MKVKIEITVDEKGLGLGVEGTNNTFEMLGIIDMAHAHLVNSLGVGQPAPAPAPQPVDKAPKLNLVKP